MNGFYWLIPRVLAGSGRPGGRPDFRNERQQLAADLDWIRSQGIGAILSLTEVSPDIAGECRTEPCASICRLSI